MIFPTVFNILKLSIAKRSYYIKSIFFILILNFIGINLFKFALKNYGDHLLVLLTQIFLFIANIVLVVIVLKKKVNEIKLKSKDIRRREFNYMLNKYNFSAFAKQINYQFTKENNVLIQRLGFQTNINKKFVNFISYDHPDYKIIVFEEFDLSPLVTRRKEIEFQNIRKLYICFEASYFSFILYLYPEKIWNFFFSDINNSYSKNSFYLKASDRFERYNNQWKALTRNGFLIFSFNEEIPLNHMRSLLNNSEIIAAKILQHIKRSRRQSYVKMIFLKYVGNPFLITFLIALFLTFFYNYLS
jgi:hypothetical protein